MIPRVDMPNISDIDRFWRLVETAFSSRRKTLRNNLKGYDLSAVNIDLSRRAETLSEGEFVMLSSELTQKE